jgi:endonuclease III
MAAKSPSSSVLSKLLKSSFGGPSELDEPRPLEQLILLILAADTDVRTARAAMKRLQSEYVDWNEARVSSAYELRRWLKGIGAKQSQEKAESLKELLTTVYNRFNKLSLDFLHREAKGAEELRKRDKFHAYLQERSVALNAMMTLHASERSDIVVTPSLTRVLQRLGLLGIKSSTVAAVRQKLSEMYPPEELVSVQWGLYSVSERHCHARGPDCAPCPLNKVCPTGAKILGKMKDVEAKAARKAAAATKKRAKTATKKAARASTQKTAKAKATKSKKAKTKTAKSKKAAKKSTNRKSAPVKKTVRRR